MPLKSNLQATYKQASVRALAHHTTSLFRTDTVTQQRHSTTYNQTSSSSIRHNTGLTFITVPKSDVHTGAGLPKGSQSIDRVSPLHRRTKTYHSQAVLGVSASFSASFSGLFLALYSAPEQRPIIRAAYLSFPSKHRPSIEVSG
jgi:hypothetical protein